MVGRSRDMKPEQGRGAPRAPVVAALDLGQFTEMKHRVI